MLFHATLSYYRVVLSITSLLLPLEMIIPVYNVYIKNNQGRWLLVVIGRFRWFSVVIGGFR